MVNDVCMCGEVSVMSGSVVSGSKNFWLFVAVDHYFMMTLQISPPKVTICLEEVFSITQECGICSIGKSHRTFGGTEPFMNAVQMVFSVAGSIRTGE